MSVNYSKLKLGTRLYSVPKRGWGLANVIISEIIGVRSNLCGGSSSSFKYQYPNKSIDDFGVSYQWISGHLTNDGWSVDWESASQLKFRLEAQNKSKPEHQTDSFDIDIIRNNVIEMNKKSGWFGFLDKACEKCETTGVTVSKKKVVKLCPKCNGNGSYSSNK